MKTADSSRTARSTGTSKGTQHLSRRFLLSLLLLSQWLLAAGNAGTDADVLDTQLGSSLGPQHLARIINDEDPLNRRIAEAYFSGDRYPPAISSMSSSTRAWRPTGKESSGPVRECSSENRWPHHRDNSRPQHTALSLVFYMFI